MDVQWKYIPPGKDRKDMDFQGVTVTEDNWAGLSGGIARAQHYIIAVSARMLPDTSFK